MDSHDTLSIAELERRLSEVRSGEMHLRTQLPKENPHNAILRIRDITRYTGISLTELYQMFPRMQRIEHRLANTNPPPGLTRQPPKAAHWQREFSRFFFGWDQGTLIKARLGDEWKIVGKYQHQTLAKMDAAPLPQAGPIRMRIDVTALGPRLKGS